MYCLKLSLVVNLYFVQCSCWNLNRMIERINLFNFYFTFVDCSCSNIRKIKQAEFFRRHLTDLTEEQICGCLVR